MRHSSVEDFDLDARELRAAEELGRRRVRLMTRVLAAAMLAGVVFGIVGYFAVQEWQFRHMGGMAVAYVSGIGFVVPLAVAALVGKLLGGMLARAQAVGMLDELARTFRVPRARLDELVRSLDELR